MTHPFVAPLIGALLMAAACSRPGAVPTAGVTDSAGVRIVRLADLDQEVFPAWSSRLVFSTESQDSLRLGPNVDAGFTPDSSLWVTAGPEVVVLDRLDRLQRRVGRSGDGPGEFRLAFRLGISADGTPFVSDFSGRLSQFAADGRLTRSIASLARGGDAQVDPISMLADGRLLATTWQQRPNKAAAPGVPVGTIVRDSAPLMVLDSAGRLIERLGLWAGAERALLDVGGEPGFLLLPFSRTALYDGRGAMAVVGSTDSLDLSLFEGTKLALRLIAPSRTGPPTSPQVADWERALRQEDSSLAKTYLRAVASAPRVARLPAVGGLVVDAAGNIWVGSYPTRQAAPRLWRVFSRTGQPLGQLELPTVFNLLMPGSAELLDVSGDRVAVRRVTASGENVVEVRAIVRP